jgi:hypothetical protein
MTKKMSLVPRRSEGDESGQLESAIPVASQWTSAIHRHLLKRK